MSATNISPEQFLEEIKAWKVTSGALVKIRSMQKGNFVYLRMSLPNNGEVIQTRILKEQWGKFDFMNYSIAIPAVWEDEVEQIKDLNKKLENANNQNITSNSYKNIRY